MLISLFYAVLLLLRISESSEWIMEYHQSRPGLKVLQQRIDQFMVEHDEKLEQVIFLFHATGVFKPTIWTFALYNTVHTVLNDIFAHA